MQSFSNQVVVITGAAGGIGKALAISFLREGARVALADVDDAKLQATADELSALGSVLAVACDVSQEHDVLRVRDAAYSEFGAVDVLCNNAGVGVAGLSWETPASV